MTISPLSPINWLGRLLSLTIRLAFTLILVAFLALEGFVVWKGLQLVGFLGVNLHGPNLVLEDLNYWEFMTSSLAASRETPASCHRNRPVGQTIMLNGV